VNIALASRGAVASANYDDGNAHLVNDGERIPGQYWVGNVDGDEVVISFPEPQLVHAVFVFTSHDTQRDKELRLSEDFTGALPNPYQIWLAEPGKDPYRHRMQRDHPQDCITNGDSTYGVDYGSDNASGDLCTFKEPVILEQIIVRPVYVRDDYPIRAIKVYEVLAFAKPYHRLARDE
jgi:hypothetical protein